MHGGTDKSRTVAEAFRDYLQSEGPGVTALEAAARFPGPLGLRAFSEATSRELRAAARIAEDPRARAGYGLVVRSAEAAERRGLVLELVVRRLVDTLRAFAPLGEGPAQAAGVHLVLCPEEPSAAEIVPALAALRSAGLEVESWPAGFYVGPVGQVWPLEVLAFRSARRLRRLGAFGAPVRTIAFLDWEEEPPGRKAEALRALTFPFAEGSDLRDCVPVALYAGASEELEAAANREASNILWGLDWMTQGVAFIRGRGNRKVAR